MARNTTTLLSVGAIVVIAATGLYMALRRKKLPIENQLASIMPYLVIVQHPWDYGIFFYDPKSPETSTLEKLMDGLRYEINVIKECDLIYNGYKYELDAGWNTIVWQAIVGMKQG